MRYAVIYMQFQQNALGVSLRIVLLHNTVFLHKWYTSQF